MLATFDHPGLDTPLMISYSNVCLLLAMLCYAVDGLGYLPAWHLASWGTFFFAAAFLTRAVRSRDRQDEP
ncbi:MAG: hypothetical protein QM796_04390 [Chthoniobacteraceae bacterium]